MRILFLISQKRKPKNKNTKIFTKITANDGVPIHFHILLSFEFLQSHLPLPFVILIVRKFLFQLNRRENNGNFFKEK